MGGGGGGGGILGHCVLTNGSTTSASSWVPIDPQDCLTDSKIPFTGGIPAMNATSQAMMSTARTDHERPKHPHTFMTRCTVSELTEPESQKMEGVPTGTANEICGVSGKLCNELGFLGSDQTKIRWRLGAWHPPRCLVRVVLIPNVVRKLGGLSCAAVKFRP